MEVARIELPYYSIAIQQMSLIGEAFESSALHVMCEYDTEGMDPKERDRLIVYHHYLSKGCRLSEYQLTEKVKRIQLKLEEKERQRNIRWTSKDKDDGGCQDRTDLSRIMSSEHSPDC